MIANYYFGPSSPGHQAAAVRRSVAAMAHAPFIAAAGPEFFGWKVSPAPEPEGLSIIFEGPQYAKWKAFREAKTPATSA